MNPAFVFHVIIPCVALLYILSLLNKEIALHNKTIICNNINLPSRLGLKHTIQNRTYNFNDLKTLMAKATPFRSGDALAGVAAETYEERVAAQMCLADVPLKTFLNEVVIPYEQDEITRLIIDSHDKDAFTTISSFTVGDLRDWLLSDAADFKSNKGCSTEYFF